MVLVQREAQSLNGMEDASLVTIGEFLESIDLVEQVDVQDRDQEYTQGVCDHLGLRTTCLGFGRRYGKIDNRR